MLFVGCVLCVPSAGANCGVCGVCLALTDAFCVRSCTVPEQ